ncbi:MAG: PKD domain-containing protein, partial [Ferruginibacter sp.]
TYHFENTSTPLNTTDSIRWTFGDGTSSNQVNPTHTYTSAGTYTVCLRIQQREPNGGLTNCIKEICHTVVVTNPATCTLIASFYSYLDTIGASPLPNLYHFINTSAPLNNTDSIRWTFGDGASSNEANPSHSYAQPGTYNVCLRVQKREPNGTLSNCIREVCHMVVVTAACNIQAHFTWIAGANPQVIHFTNNSLSPTIAVTASWSFGDGSSSTAWSPVHDYAHAGTYTVCLNIQSGPNCISHYCASVVVPASPVDCIHQSDFGIIQSTTNSQLFYFVPDHINTTSTYTWTFGDGTGSHNTNVSHQYPQAGNYTACLTVYHDTNCASTSCHSVTVLQQVNCANVNVTYSYQHDPVILNQLYFHAISGTTLIDQVWTITKLPSTATTPPVIIHQNNPTYTFQDTGHYRVCLRAVTAGGCVKEYCEIIFITQVNPANCILQVYPNPATNFIYFILNLSQPQTIDTYIYNTMNVLVQEQHQAGVSGTNAITVGIANLPAGIYTMKVIHGNDVCYAQIVKL